MSWRHFLQKRFRSFGFAFKGLYALLKSEANFQIQFLIALGVSAAGFYFQIDKVEWFMQTVMIALVMSLEGLNTAIEKLADTVHPAFDEKIGLAKDMAAAAVLISALIAVIIAAFIYVPRLF
jgi:diacylglycerol kinase (ATP)